MNSFSNSKASIVCSRSCSVICCGRLDASSVFQSSSEKTESNALDYSLNRNHTSSSFAIFGNFLNDVVCQQYKCFSDSSPGCKSVLFISNFGRQIILQSFPNDLLWSPVADQTHSTVFTACLIRPRYPRKRNEFWCISIEVFRYNSQLSFCFPCLSMQAYVPSNSIVS